MIEKGVDKAVRTSISNDLAANTPPITQETSLARNATPILGASTSAVIPQVPENHHEHAAIRCNGVLKQLLLIKTASEPLAYGIATKWLITLVVAGAAAVDPISSTILYPALPQLAKDLNISPTVANLAVSLSKIFTAVCPLWWSYLSEREGRRIVYLVSLILCLVFAILSAKSSSIGMLVAMRVLGGGTGCSVTAVGAGTIADIWAVDERGKAMGIYYLGPLLGPAIGPVIGGALAQRFGWRATQWFLAIFSGICLVGVATFLPETFGKDGDTTGKQEKTFEGEKSMANTVSDQPSRKSWIRIRSLAYEISRGIFEPLKVLKYLRFPAILLPVYLASISFGIIGVWTISIQQTFSSPPYHYNALIIGLLYLPFSLGLIFGSILGGKWSDYIMARNAKAAGSYDEKGKVLLRPEYRVGENAWLSIVLFPGGLLCYGWTAYYGITSVVPMIATFPIGAGSMLIFGLVTTMLTEIVPKKSASLVALNALGRNLFSCIGGVVAQPLITAVSTRWLFTGLCGIALASSVVIWALRKYGSRWREDLDRAL